MKFNFKDYIQYCKLNNIKSSYYSSLKLFKAWIEVAK